MLAPTMALIPTPLAVDPDACATCGAPPAAQVAAWPIRTAEPGCCRDCGAPALAPVRGRPICPDDPDIDF